MLFNFIFLQAEAPGGGMMQFLIIGLMIVVFYFFMIRPQQKKQKEQRKFRDALKKGDLVVTIGGAHGRVFSVEKDNVVVEVDRGVKIQYDKSAIAGPSEKKPGVSTTS